jgi:hypothetical protein
MPEIVYFCDGEAVYRLPVKPEELDFLRINWRVKARKAHKRKK